MTEKELRKLKRSDFLQLLLTQGKDMSAVQTRLDETTAGLEELRAANERLQTKVDEKDELIEKLTERLSDKDATISALQQEIENIKESRQIELEKAGSIAAAALSLNGIFETAQKAADQYLENIRRMHDEVEAQYKAETAKQKPAKPAAQPAEAPKAPKSESVAPAKLKAKPPTEPTAPKSKSEVPARQTQISEFIERLRKRGK